MDRKSRAAINRANARKSTGPRTEAGKNIAPAKVSRRGSHRAASATSRFFQEGGLMATSKMIDNYSRHQTRLHRIYRDLTGRLDDLLARRDPDEERAGFVWQKDSGFVSRTDSGIIPKADPRFVLQKSLPVKFQPPRDSCPGHYKQYQLQEIGFVLQKRVSHPPASPKPQEPAA